MAMIAPNFLVCQKEGLGRRKRREVEEREDRRELRRQTRMLPQVQLGQGCRMRGTGENMERGDGFHSTEEARD